MVPAAVFPTRCRGEGGAAQRQRQHLVEDAMPHPPYKMNQQYTPCFMPGLRPENPGLEEQQTSLTQPSDPLSQQGFPGFRLLQSTPGER